ncbi:hypothetical protein [Noviherbaspirillum galbum]|uniref:Uncharacterized protein n=1 Tax=Noviherbaspirillum galbum TaxID=2709383 RepID=A0A6B3SXP3_9BURK|nr:hypothetical protein [Noviherbaspirillum galbum]NEX63302.1 hypothetical protein [Noviherbaspirillum galbum]
MAKESVRAGLQPDSLVRNIVGQAAMTALGAFRGGKAGRTPGFDAATLLPLAMRFLPLLAGKRTRLTPWLRGAVAAGAVAAAATWLLRRRQESEPENADGAADAANDLSG